VRVLGSKVTIAAGGYRAMRYFPLSARIGARA